MQGFLIEKFGTLVIPMLLGPIVYFVMKYLKVAIAWIDSQNPLVQRGILVAVAAVISAVAGATGTDLACLHTQTGCQLTDLSDTAVKTILASGSAMLLHYFRKLPSDSSGATS